MFKSIIANTPLTTEAANEYFEGKIGGNMYQGDVSFLSTLRALLGSREMDEEESVFLFFGSSSYDEYALRNAGIDMAINAIVPARARDSGILYIHSFHNESQTANRAWMEMVQSSFEEKLSGWHRVEKVTTFFRKAFFVLCYINPRLKSTIVFTEKMTAREMHYLQCGIFPFMPWYFDQETGVSEIEMELMKSLREKTSDKYEECIAKIAERYDFRTAHVRQLLRGFESRYERIQLDRAECDMETVISNIDSYNQAIAGLLKKKRDYENMILGLEAKIAQTGENSEIMEYFLCNKRLALESVTDSTMKFVVCGYASYFDEEMARRVIDNPGSYVYRPNTRNCNNIIPAEDMKMLMEAIFIDGTLKLRFCAAYELQLEGRAKGLSSYSYSADYREYMPNPHIDRYACLGNNEYEINRCLKDNNYIGAIEQCIASCKSLNFADSTVMREFMLRMYGISERHTNNRCIELPDGRVVVPKEAIKYLKEANVENG